MTTVFASRELREQVWQNRHGLLVEVAGLAPLRFPAGLPQANRSHHSLPPSAAIRLLMATGDGTTGPIFQSPAETWVIGESSISGGVAAREGWTDGRDRRRAVMASQGLANGGHRVLPARDHLPPRSTRMSASLQERRIDSR